MRERAEFMVELHVRRIPIKMVGLKIKESYHASD
jgi:hypothetical protein